MTKEYVHLQPVFEGLIEGIKDGHEVRSSIKAIKTFIDILVNKLK